MDGRRWTSDAGADSLADMAKRREPRERLPVDARAMIVRARVNYLIVRPGGDPEAPWRFPGGSAEADESPEAALRRTAREQLGVELEILVGQPPFVHRTSERAVTYRYYVCAILRGEPATRGGGEMRWVQAAQLRDYVFDEPTQKVVDWIIEEHGRRGPRM